MFGKRRRWTAEASLMSERKKWADNVYNYVDDCSKTFQLSQHCPTTVDRTLNILQQRLQGGQKKRIPSFFGDNFGKSAPILTILSL